MHGRKPDGRLENCVEADDNINVWLEAIYDWADANRVWLDN